MKSIYYPLISGVLFVLVNSLEPLAPNPYGLIGSAECGYNGWDSVSGIASKCFKVLSPPLEWYGGWGVCRQENDAIAPSTLLQIHSRYEEELFVSWLLQQNSNGSVEGVWLGATTLGNAHEFTWNDGSPIHYAHWGWRAIEGNCAELDIHSPLQFEWRKSNCGDKKTVVCQMDISNVSDKDRVGYLLRENLNLKMELGALGDRVEGLEGRHCGVAPSARAECGWGGITQWECLSRGCCFDNSIRNTKWCFKKVVDSSKFIRSSPIIVVNSTE